MGNTNSVVGALCGTTSTVCGIIEHVDNGKRCAPIASLTPPTYVSIGCLALTVVGAPIPFVLPVVFAVGYECYKYKQTGRVSVSKSTYFVGGECLVYGTVRCMM